MFAYCLEMPGVTEAMTVRVDEEVGSAPVPGLVAHVSGPSNDGWRIIDIWETEADQQRFQTERLGPAVTRATAGMSGPPPVPFDMRSVTGVDALTRGALAHH
jgi:hypothetical protein